MRSKLVRYFRTSFSHLPPKTRNSLKILLLAVFSVTAFLFHIWFRTKVLTAGYLVGSLRKEISQLESQIVSLGVEKNRVMGPDQLERLVSYYDERGIKLESPQKAQMIYLSREGLNP